VTLLYLVPWQSTPLTCRVKTQDSIHSIQNVMIITSDRNLRWCSR